MWKLRVAPARRRARVRRNLGAGRLRRPLLRFFGVVLSDDAANRGEYFLHRGVLRFCRLGHAVLVQLALPSSRLPASVASDRMRRITGVDTCRITCLASCKIAARPVVAQVDGADILGT